MSGLQGLQQLADEKISQDGVTEDSAKEQRARESSLRLRAWCVRKIQQPPLATLF